MIGLLKKINTLLSKKDVGLKELLGELADDSDVREVSIFLLKYYTNLRGKDYVRKWNAKSTISAETLRATVGVRFEVAREKNVNDRKRLSQNNPTPSNESKENANDSEGEEQENVSDFETMLKEQLKALCRQYNLPVSGNKPVLLNLLRDFTASQQNKSGVEESVSDEVDEESNTEQKDIAGKVHEANITVKCTKTISGTSGLCNLGNTCFMNAALQCLVHSTQLADFFLSKNCEIFLSDEKLGPSFAKLIDNIYQSRYSTYSPDSFL
jgi:hypothetical protein